MDWWTIYRAAYLICFCGIALISLAYGVTQYFRGKGWLSNKPDNSLGILFLVAQVAGYLVYRFAPGELAHLGSGIFRNIVIGYVVLSLVVLGGYLLLMAAQAMQYRKDGGSSFRRTNSEWVAVLMLMSAGPLASILDKPLQ